MEEIVCEDIDEAYLHLSASDCTIEFMHKTLVFEAERCVKFTVWKLSASEIDFDFGCRNWVQLCWQTEVNDKSKTP